MQFPKASGKIPHHFAAIFVSFCTQNMVILHPQKAILHPILHPKTPLFTWCFYAWCRKCRIIQETFFLGGGEWRNVKDGIVIGMKTIIVKGWIWFHLLPSFPRLGNNCASTSLPIWLNGYVSGNWKHRTSLYKTSVLLRQNLRTFTSRSPMFFRKTSTGFVLNV